MCALPQKTSGPFWVSGIPATFATRRERPWKQALERSVLRPAGQVVDGLVLRFSLPTLAPHGQPLDIDNLCEPVFSVVINKLGWFGGKRPNLRWWHATKTCGQPSGLRLSVHSVSPRVISDGAHDECLDTTYTGTLPRKATDDGIPSWLNSLGGFKPPAKHDRFAVQLQFGGSMVNIGDIATGNVKAVLDCLYPVIGGVKGKPEDWRVDVANAG